MGNIIPGGPVLSLDLRQLRHFDALFRLRSFRLAADEQGLTHSALTKSLQKLEAILGLALFDRTTRTVHPTAAGERLAERAAQLLRDADQLEGEARAMRGGGEGRVNIGAAPLPIEALIGPALTCFVAANPHVQVSVAAAPLPALVEGLLARKYDFVVLGGVASPVLPFEEAIAAELLPSEPAVIVARQEHPLVLRAAPSVEYLDYPWAAPQLSEDDYRQFPDAFRLEMTRRGIPQYRLESLSACWQLALDSDVLTGAPLSVGRRIAAAAAVQLVPYPFPVEAHYALLKLRDRSLLPAAAQLRAGIARAAQRNAKDRLAG